MSDGSIGTAGATEPPQPSVPPPHPGWRLPLTVGPPPADPNPRRHAVRR